MIYEEFYNSDFQRGLREFQAQSQAREEKKKCYHPYTISAYGWRICLTCGKYLRKKSVFRNEEYYCDRAMVRKKIQKDRLAEMRTIFSEMLDSISSVDSSYLSILSIFCMRFIYPRNSMDDLPIRFRTHSLCTAVLWKKVKELDIKISFSEFSEKCGVSKCTISKVYKLICNK